jgi:hypothetical protein
MSKQACSPAGSLCLSVEVCDGKIPISYLHVTDRWISHRYLSMPLPSSCACSHILESLDQVDFTQQLHPSCIHCFGKLAHIGAVTVLFLSDLFRCHAFLVACSHISESLDQVAFTQQLHPSCSSDAHVYDQAGLLTNEAIFAHGTQLTEQDMRLMAERGTAVAHCPLSNFYFGDGERFFCFVV